MDRYDPYTDTLLRDTQYNILGANLAEVGTDCISRQAAIDAINEIIRMEHSLRPKIYVAKDAIKKMPSVQLATDTNVGTKLGTNLAEVGTDCISRQAAIDALETVGYNFSESELSEVELEEVCGAVSDVRQDMMVRIKQLPSAQPEPLKIDLSGYSEEDWERLKKEWGNTPITVLSAQPKRGRWERHYSRPNVYADLFWHCSECGYRSSDNWADKFNFCPNCGTDMRGEQDE